MPRPCQLDDEQRKGWAFRQRRAANTLAIQALDGTVPSAETIACFRRYVSGESSLAQAIAQVREQLAEDHAAIRKYLNRRNSN
jgi:hypothetical protein